MRIYLSGPITGHEDTAAVRFAAAAREARAAAEMHGIPPELISIMNPLLIGEAMQAFCNDLRHLDFMIVDLALLHICDVIYMMEGWQYSAGCKVEHRTALDNGYRIIYQNREDETINS